MKSKLTLSLTILGVALTLLSACATDAQATDTAMRIDGGGNHIQVINGHKDYETIYRVNGKQFTKSDLSQSQQNRLTKAENKLKQVQFEFDKKESDISAYTAKIDAHAAKITQAASNIELAVAALDLENTSISELHSKQAELEAIMREHEELMQSNEMKMLKAESTLFKIEQALIDDIETEARNYEQVLVAIASEL